MTEILLGAVILGLLASAIVQRRDINRLNDRFDGLEDRLKTLRADDCIGLVQQAIVRRFEDYRTGSGRERLRARLERRRQELKQVVRQELLKKGVKR